LTKCGASVTWNKVTCSIFNAALESLQLRRPDWHARAYRASGHGLPGGESQWRNRAEFYNVSAKQSERMIQDVQWMRSIRQALENNDFRLYYQPLMHIATRKVSTTKPCCAFKRVAGLSDLRHFCLEWRDWA
jgi:hypothetical protein